MCETEEWVDPLGPPGGTCSPLALRRSRHLHQQLASGREVKEEDSGAGSERALTGKVHGLEVFSEVALGAHGFLEHVPVLLSS